MNSIKKILYRVTLDVHKLKINKNIDFETKIMWKRHQKKAQTQPVKHAHGYSVYNQTLELEFEMPYNPQTGSYQSKNTQIVAVIVYQGRVKSGGYAKYNISQCLNKNPYEKTDLTIPMTQCPDPSAFVQISLSYEKLGDQLEGGDMSVLNVSSRDLNMSRIDFKDDKLSFEMDKINDVIGKFQSLITTVKQKGKQNGRKIPEMMTKVQCLQGQKYALLTTIEKLEKDIKQKEKALQDEKKKARQGSQELEKQLEKKNRELKELRNQGISVNKSKENIPDYKEMYENAVRQLQELRSGDNALRKSLDLRLAGSLDDVQKIADFSNNKSEEDEDEGEDEEKNERMEELSRQNVQLQSQVASMSHKLAQLFNASYQFGGAKLLDYLQTSIGLTEMDQ